MRILIIGGTGFIGIPLTNRLVSDGHEVVVFHRSKGAKPHPSITEILGNREHLFRYRAEISSFAPDVAIDMVLSSARQAKETVRTLRGLVPRLVVLSSADVYHAWGVCRGLETGLQQVPLTERSHLRRKRRLYPGAMLRDMANRVGWLDSSYDKIGVESVVMDATGLSGTVLRLPMVYGPGDPYHRVYPVVKRIVDQRPAILLMDDLAAWRVARGYVDNVAHAIALTAICERAAKHIYNVSDEPTFTELEWASKIASYLRWRGRFVLLPQAKIPKHLRAPGKFAQDLIVSSARIREELGYKEMAPIDEAIGQTVRWQLSNPPDSINAEEYDYAAEDAIFRSGNLAELDLSRGHKA